MEYTMGMIGKQATLARLRRSRRLPFTEAAYNGHQEVLQVTKLFFYLMMFFCLPRVREIAQVICCIKKYKASRL